MSRDTTLLHPTLQAKLQQFLTACKASGLNVLITETLRTVAEQDAKYAQGRTKAGPVVTNAKGSSYSSQHQWGIAFDFCKNVKGQEYSDTKFFKQCGAIAKGLGLGWGGDWKNPVDMPHVYLKDWGSTASTLKSKYGTPDKFKATWDGTKTTTPPQATTIYSKTQFIKDVQSAIGVKVDGIAGSKTLGATITVSATTNNKHKVVKPLQKYLNYLGYNCGTVDGIAGSKFTSAVKSYQKNVVRASAKNQDGVISAKGSTWKKLLGLA